MKILNKWELQQIAFNHSSNIDFKEFMNLYKKWTAKPYSFLVTDATLATDTLSGFRKNLLEKIRKLIIKINDKIREEKAEKKAEEKQQKKINQR